MTVKEMIDALSKLPPDAEIFAGDQYPAQRGAEDKTPMFELYDREPALYERVWSLGSGAPWKRSIKENVVILEIS